MARLRALLALSALAAAAIPLPGPFDPCAAQAPTVALPALGSVATVSSGSYSSGVHCLLTVTAGTAGLKAVATQYAYADWPVLSVYTTTGLPVMPWGPRNLTQ